jgi:hypothetical protein
MAARPNLQNLTLDDGSFDRAVALHVCDAKPDAVS